MANNYNTGDTVVNFTITGDLDHNGSNVGLYGVAPAARPATITQTYATATRTHANPVAATVTDTGGVAGFLTGADRTAVVTAVNNLITDHANLAQLVNAIVDNLQLLGIEQ
mgnify:CR=1 FL=1